MTKEPRLEYRQEQQEFRNDQDSTTKKSRLLLYVPLPLETGCCLTILHTPQEHMGSPLCCQLHHCSRKSSPVTSVLICYFSVFKTQPGPTIGHQLHILLSTDTKRTLQPLKSYFWLAYSVFLRGPLEKIQPTQNEWVYHTCLTHSVKYVMERGRPAGGQALRSTHSSGCLLK